MFISVRTATPVFVLLGVVLALLPTIKAVDFEVGVASAGRKEMRQAKSAGKYANAGEY